MRLLLGMGLVMAATACTKSASSEWERGLEQFHQARQREIVDEWLTLQGRYTLQEGPNVLGSGADAWVRLPADRAEADIGTLMVGESLTWTPREGASTPLEDDARGHATVFEHGSLRMHVIRRGEERFLRVKDLKHPALAGFHGLEWFPPNAQWRLTGTFEPAAQGATVEITNVLNRTSAQRSPGSVRFEKDGKTFRLVAVDYGEPGLFFVFKDETAGKGSYAAGRFLHVDAAKADGSVDLDFNRAYSPPCAFTNFATCPLPPRSNQLALKIEAGERTATAHP